MSACEVIVTREDGSWLAGVPTVPGAHTFARSLAGVARSIREVIILMADLHDDATPDLTFTCQVSDEAAQEAAAAGRNWPRGTSHLTVSPRSTTWIFVVGAG
jgi:predicted RNase H-like HicB family nuclease